MLFSNTVMKSIILINCNMLKMWSILNSLCCFNNTCDISSELREELVARHKVLGLSEVYQVIGIWVGHCIHANHCPGE